MASIRTISDHTTTNCSGYRNEKNVHSPIVSKYYGKNNHGNSLSTASTITLPKLHIPTNEEIQMHRMQGGWYGQQTLTSGITPRMATIFSHSPSSPFSFFDRSSQSNAKFGLNHLIEAAQQCVPLETNSPNTRKRLSPAISSSSMYPTTPISPLTIKEPREMKRPRLQSNPELYHAPRRSNSTPTHLESTSSKLNPNSRVWATVLATNKFPDDIGLNESNVRTDSGSEQEMTEGFKREKWNENKSHNVEDIIASIRSGETSLPANMSLRQYVAMHVQVRSPPTKIGRNRSQSTGSVYEKQAHKFNPLSLKNIMNSDTDNEGESDNGNISPSTKKTSHRSLKRSDYSQHGTVRSGRWSPEEEAYARAMIEAFKAGFLPLHGNISLRKFLSDVLVCHPMRVSKKFVGYVRKHHWYRVAAGKYDETKKRRAIEELCILEQNFWNSLRRHNEYTGWKEKLAEC